DFSEHRQAQQYLLKELWYLRDELIAKNGLWSDGAAKHFIRFLEDWMIGGHIIGLDMRMKPALQAHDYSFRPGLGGGAGHTGKADCSPAPAAPSAGVCGCGCGCDSHLPACRDSRQRKLDIAIAACLGKWFLSMPDLEIFI
ncbi:MAG TPA: hypothetical protein VFQ99_05900, partial [Gallionella sp.]|nr:hypothetical protein [Gallionella sp.]